MPHVTFTLVSTAAAQHLALLIANADGSRVRIVPGAPPRVRWIRAAGPSLSSALYDLDGTDAVAGATYAITGNAVQGASIRLDLAVENAQ